MQVPTSEGTLLSTVHGRDRRETRTIGARDLQAAVKYGLKEPTFNGRWKFTFTESDCRTEVTSWVIPTEVLPAECSHDDERLHNSLTLRMKHFPSICTSHLVVIIDQSASMRTCDVDNYKTRSDAVFATVALDYIGKQIDNRRSTNAQYTDAVTLIEMNETSSVRFAREPCTNVLFNKFVARKTEVRPYGHGMFRGALELATEVMMPDRMNKDCNLVLMFLTDGRPSDRTICGDIFNTRIFDEMTSMCSLFGDQLTVSLLGFAKRGTDFSVLETMAEYARAAGSRATFTAVDLRGNGLSTTIQSLSTTMTQTRQQASVAAYHGASRVIRNIASEPSLSPYYCFESDVDRFNDTDWRLYVDGFNVWCWDKRRKELVMTDHGDGIAIHKAKFGEGAERVVFKMMRLAHVQNGSGFSVAKERLVAKESRYEGSFYERREFHTLFCKTQSHAARLANKFNAKVSAICGRIGLPIPAVIHFLPCSVFEVPNPDGIGFRFILAESRLDPTKYMKWNSNNGYAAGQHRSALSILTGDVAAMTVKSRAAPLHMIAEESDEESIGEDDDGDDDDKEDHNGKINNNFAPMPSVQERSVLLTTADQKRQLSKFNIRLEDVPQAFSHYSYRYSQREQLVCYLQGVLDDTVTPPVFNLTDPVIHFNSRSGREHVFGKTDHGHKGMTSFFKTHECNDMCRMLGFASFF